MTEILRTPEDVAIVKLLAFYMDQGCIIKFEKLGYNAYQITMQRDYKRAQSVLPMDHLVKLPMALEFLYAKIKS